MATDELLEKLLQQERELKKQIQAAKREKAKKDTALYNERCKLIGAAILAEKEQNAAFYSQIEWVLDKHTKKQKDRKTLELVDKAPTKEAPQDGFEQIDDALNLDKYSTTSEYSSSF